MRSQLVIYSRHRRAMKTAFWMSCSCALVWLGFACTPPTAQTNVETSTRSGDGAEGTRAESSVALSREAPPEETVNVTSRRCALPEEIREPGWPHVLEPTRAGAPSPPPNGGRTIAVLPDTQYYVNCKNDHFERQTKWLAGEIDERNVVATIHLGDLTEHNTESEWQKVKNALSPLSPRVPLILATGNHDYGELGQADRRHTLFQKFFAHSPAPTQKVLAETMLPDDPENAYFRVPFGRITLGILVLEWSPRSKTVAWGRETLNKYPNDRVIFVTHAYLYYDGTRYDYAKYGEDQSWNPRSYGTARLDPKMHVAHDNWHPDGAYDAEMLWNELLEDHPGVFLTLNGHVLGDGAAVLSSRGTKNNLVHQVLVNYQMLDEGGLGYLRLIEIDETGTKMEMKTYSPSLDRTATAEDQAFVLPIEPPLW